MSNVHQSLITQKISKESFVACLMGFSCLTKVFGKSKQSRFRKQRRKFNKKSATVTTVWNIIGDYISFFDYEVLETIVDALGTDQDKQNMAEYKNDFKAYAGRHLFIQIPSQNDPSPKEGNVLLFVLLDSSYNGCTIGHLKKLQNKLSTIFNLASGVLQLRKVKKGSVQLVFEIPCFTADAIFPLSLDQEVALLELRVTQLDCGNYHFRAKV